ncbi:MAG TPA: CHRD domain-containing protein [Thermoanaerobaculia bacterium]|nr:CHRD domain-containing protein [Thermoanaerobaculia bacterium]
MRAILAAAVVLALAVPAAAQPFVFNLRGSHEVSPTDSIASGGCFGQLDQPGAAFSITCVHNVVNATLMRIHRGAAGVNGPVIFDLGDPETGLITATWSSMTFTDISDLLAGNLYINIHTAGFTLAGLSCDDASRSWFASPHRSLE